MKLWIPSIASNLPDLLSEMPQFCCPTEIFIIFLRLVGFNLMHHCSDRTAFCITHFYEQTNTWNILNYGQTTLRVSLVALCIPSVEPKLTARPWFRALNFYQGQSAYPGLVAELVIYIEKNLRLVWFHQMHCSMIKAALCITRVELELSLIQRKKLRFVGFYHMNGCTDKSSKT